MKDSTLSVVKLYNRFRIQDSTVETKLRCAGGRQSISYCGYISSFHLGSLISSGLEIVFFPPLCMFSSLTAISPFRFREVSNAKSS